MKRKVEINDCIHCPFIKFTDKFYSSGVNVSCCFMGFHEETFDNRASGEVKILDYWFNDLCELEKIE